MLTTHVPLALKRLMLKGAKPPVERDKPISNINLRQFDFTRFYCASMHSFQAKTNDQAHQHSIDAI